RSPHRICTQAVTQAPPHRVKDWFDSIPLVRQRPSYDRWRLEQIQGVKCIGKALVVEKHRALNERAWALVQDRAQKNGPPHPSQSRPRGPGSVDQYVKMAALRYSAPLQPLQPPPPPARTRVLTFMVFTSEKS